MINDMKSRIFTLLLISFPILRIYATIIPGVNLAELLALIYVAYKLIKVKFGVTISINSNQTNLLILFVIYFFMTAISYLYVDAFSIIAVIARLLRWGFYIILVVLSRQFIDKEFAIKWMKRLTILVSVGLWVQIISYRLFGIVATLKIPGLELFTDTFDVERMLRYYQGNFFRPFSVFLEPAHYSYYAIIGLCLFLFINNNEKDKYGLLKALFVTASLVASTSTSAFFLVFFVWGYYFLMYFFYKKSKEKYIIGFLFLFLSIIMLFYFSETQMFQYAANKVFGVSDFGGFRMNAHNTYIDKMSGLEKAFGIGIGNEKYYFSNVRGVEFVYSNTIGYMIIGSGYFGLALFFIYMVKALKKTTTVLRVFLWVFLLTNLYSSMLYSSNSILFLIWPFYFSNEMKLMSLNSSRFNNKHSKNFRVE